MLSIESLYAFKTSKFKTGNLVSNLMNSFWAKDKGLSVVTTRYLAENLFISVMEDGSVSVLDIYKEKIIHTFDFRFEDSRLYGCIFVKFNFRMHI